MKRNKEQFATTAEELRILRSPGVKGVTAEAFVQFENLKRKRSLSIRFLRGYLTSFIVGVVAAYDEVFDNRAELNQVAIEYDIPKKPLKKNRKWRMENGK